MSNNSVPKALTRGYSNSFLDTLAVWNVTEPTVLTQAQLEEMDK